LYVVINNEPTFQITLETGTSVTTVSNQLAGKDSFIDFMPETSAAAVAKQSMYVSSRGDSTFDITHDVTATANRTFTYFIHG
jgi:hypothetical protein